MQRIRRNLERKRDELERRRDELEHEAELSKNKPRLYLVLLKPSEWSGPPNVTMPDSEDGYVSGPADLL